MKQQEGLEIAQQAIFDQMKAFITHPPKDPEEFARVSADLARRYIDLHV